MSVKIEFNIDNDAFADDMEIEITRVPRKIAYEVDHGYLKNDIRDINGNQIGAYTVD